MLPSSVRGHRPLRAETRFVFALFPESGIWLATSRFVQPIQKGLVVMEFEWVASDVYSAVGLIGVVLYVSAYAALQLGLIAGQSYRYSLLNLAAASCVLFSLSTHFNLSSALIQVFWIVLSIIGVSRLYWVASRIKLNPEETLLIENKFPSLTKTAARKLLDSGCWFDVPPNTSLVVEDHPVTELVYLSSGHAIATLDDKRVGQCAPGSFIGEVTCLTGEPASATVSTTTDSRYFCIGTGRLRQLHKQDAEIRAAIDSAFAADTGRKLRAANRATKVSNAPVAAE